jgi:hypothetical protein
MGVTCQPRKAPNNGKAKCRSCISRKTTCDLDVIPIQLFNIRFEEGDDVVGRPAGQESGSSTGQKAGSAAGQKAGSAARRKAEPSTQQMTKTRIRRKASTPIQQEDSSPTEEELKASIQHLTQATDEVDVLIHETEVRLAQAVWSLTSQAMEAINLLPLNELPTRPPTQ